MEPNGKVLQWNPAAYGAPPSDIPGEGRAAGMSQGKEVWQLRSPLPAKLTQASKEEEEGEWSESAQARAGPREAGREVG